MKQFNIAKNQQIVFGHIIPKNAIYGKFTYNGVYKKPVDGVFETIKNKHGKVVFTKDGMPKMRQVYKLVPFKNTVIYSLEDFKEYRRSNNKFCQIYILYADSQKWTLANTDDNTTLEKLYEFIKNRLKGQGQYLQLLKSPEKPCINGNTITMPKRRNIQKDYLYRGIPMKNPDDTDVKPRISIVHTNLDKCKNNTATHEQYTSPYSWEYRQTPKKSGNIEAVAAMNATK